MPNPARPADVTGRNHGESLLNRIAREQGNPEDGDVVPFDQIGMEPKVEQPAEKPDEEKKAETQETDLPDKFKGKSVDEVVKMYQNLETAYGRQGTDLGNLRKVYDQVLLKESQPQNTPPQERHKVTFDELLEDPDTVINRAVENHPKLKQAEQTVQLEAQHKAQQALAAKHPDYEQVLSDPEFAIWIQANPTLQRIAQVGNMTNNADDVAYVLSTYKTQNQSTQIQQQEQRETAMQKASVETHTTGAPVQTGERKQYFRRSDLMKLLETDRERYDHLYPQIALAYKEGRVLD